MSPFWMISGLALALGGTAYALWRGWVNPTRRLEQLLRTVAEGRTPPSYLVDGSPWFGRVSGLIEQIAERQQALQRQIDTDSFNLRAILGSMIEGVMVVDSQHRIRLFNQEFINLFKLTQSPLDRTVLEALRHAEIELMVRDTIASSERHTREVMLQEPHPDIPPRYFEVSIVPLRLREGLVSGAVAVFHDISRIKQLEEVRREFVANVSHELRTPLAIFRGYLETMFDQPKLPRAETRRALETMMRHSNRLNALVDDLLTLTRMESRRVQLHLVSLRLEPFLRQVIDDYRRKLGDKPVEFVLRLPPSVPAIEADPLRLEQIMFNLFENAYLYSKEDKSIEVEVQVETGRLVMSVSDRGIGIPRGDLPHIFERFYRVDKGRSRQLGGTGLGLSIVKHIMQRHGGDVAAESELGQGTRILLYFPLAAAVPTETSALSPKALKSRAALAADRADAAA